MSIVQKVRTEMTMKQDLMFTYSESIFQTVQTLAFTNAALITVFHSLMCVMVTLIVVMGQMKKAAVHVRKINII